jgi:endonuclease YncB( thermonuclease family)
MQRDVEVEVSGVDRMGAFLGNVVIVSTRGERQDVSKMLITSGMGYIHESFDSRDAGGSALVAAEKSAREGKIGLWVDYKEPEIEEVVKAMRIEPGNPPKAMVGMVCEIGFGGRLFVHTSDKSKVIISAVEAGLKSLNLDDTAAIPVASLKAGEIVAAKFSADGLWYRAKILTKSAAGARVRFIDYGNEETVAAADIRRPSGAIGFMSSPPAAIEVVLADIVVPEAHDNFGLEAGEFIRDLVYGKTVDVIVNATEGTSKVIGDVRIVDDADSNGAEVNGTPGSSSAVATAATSGSPKSTSLTEKLLESGIVRIVRKSDRVSRVAFSRLSEFEKIGQATRDFLWTYGDAYESDCDDEDEVKDRNRVRRGGR